MQIGTDDPYRGWRIAEVRAAMEPIIRREREQAYAAAGGSAGEAQEVRLQRKAAAESSTFVAAQRPIIANGILGVEGASPGTVVDIRV